VKEREEARKQWKAWTMRHLCEGDRARMRKSSTPSDKKDREITANTPVETANVLRDTEHDWRLYSDGGCDGNGAKGIWGDSGWGVAIYEVGTDLTGGEDDNDLVKEFANLYGNIVTDKASGWYMYAVRGTNQTGELTGVIEGLLWLMHVCNNEGDAIMLIDSLYAANMIDGVWNAENSKNKDLVMLGRRLLEEVRKKRAVTFVHIKGHSADGGNDRADLLVQWGKTDGPYSRILEVGSVEGPGIAAVVTEPPPGVKRKPEKVPVEDDENSSDDEDWGMFGSLMAEALEVDMEIETEEPKDSGWRDAGWREEESDDSSLGSMLACLLSPYSDEEDVEAEKMMEERAAEASELDEMLAEQESMNVMRRPDGDSDLDLYQSPALERRSGQTGLTPGMKTMIVSVGNSVIVTQGGSRGPLPNI
jgi:ribonuclease HI